MNEFDLDLTNLPENSLIANCLGNAVIHKMNRERFLSNYNTLLTKEIINELLLAVRLGSTFDQAHIFFPSVKSKYIDERYDRMWHYLAYGIRPQKKFIWGPQMVKWFNYGTIPYAIFYRFHNQAEPDFILFGNSVYPQELIHNIYE